MRALNLPSEYIAHPEAIQVDGLGTLRMVSEPGNRSVATVDAFILDKTSKKVLELDCTDRVLVGELYGSGSFDAAPKPPDPPDPPSIIPEVGLINFFNLNAEGGEV